MTTVKELIEVSLEQMEEVVGGAGADCACDPQAAGVCSPCVE